MISVIHANPSCGKLAFTLDAQPNYRDGIAVQKVPVCQACGKKLVLGAMTRQAEFVYHIVQFPEGIEPK